MDLEILSFQEAEKQEEDGIIRFFCEKIINLNSKNYETTLEKEASDLETYTLAMDLTQNISDPPKSSDIFVKFYKRKEILHMAKKGNYEESSHARAYLK